MIVKTFVSLYELSKYCYVWHSIKCQINMEMLEQQAGFGAFYFIINEVFTAK